MVVAVDFDGTVASWRPLQWAPGARRALQAMRRAGHTVILHSARLRAPDSAQDPAGEAEAFYRRGVVPERVRQQWAEVGELRQFLAEDAALFSSWWTLPGKPLADLYLDDRAEPADWAALAQELG